MARKKKKKLVVELDLPKDDKTLKNLYIIIFISIILGLSSGIMWATNSGFIPLAIFGLISFGLFVAPILI